MEGIKNMFGTKLPSFYTEAKKSISESITHFNAQDGYFLKHDAVSDEKLKELLISKYNEEVKKGLKFLLGVRIGRR